MKSLYNVVMFQQQTLEVGGFSEVTVRQSIGLSAWLVYHCVCVCVWGGAAGVGEIGCMDISSFSWVI